MSDDLCHTLQRDGRSGFQQHFIVAARMIHNGANFRDAPPEQSGPGGSGWKPIHYAAHGCGEMSIALLAELGVDINCKDDEGWTPLHHVAAGSNSNFNSVISLRVLLDSGADRTLRNNQGQTFIDIVRQAPNYVGNWHDDFLAEINSPNPRFGDERQFLRNMLRTEGMWVRNGGVYLTPEDPPQPARSQRATTDRPQSIRSQPTAVQGSAARNLPPEPQREQHELEQRARDLRAQREREELRRREKDEQQLQSRMIAEADGAVRRALESTVVPVASVSWEYVCHITNNLETRITQDRLKVFASSGPRAALGNKALVVKLVPVDCEREIRAFEKVFSPNVVRLLAIASIPENVVDTVAGSALSGSDRRGLIVYAEGKALIFERSQHGSIDDVLRNDAQATRLQWKQRHSIAVDITQGLADIATCGLFHHDVRSANVIIAEVPDDEAEFERTKHVAQLIDLEFAKETQATVWPDEGRAGYMCPLYAQGFTQYGEKQEVYGLGVFLLELFTGRVAAEERYRLLARDLRLLVPDPRIDSAENSPLGALLLDLGKRATDQYPDRRPTLNECLAELKAAAGTGASAISFRVPIDMRVLKRCVICDVQSGVGVCCTGSSRDFLCHRCFPGYAQDQADRGNLMHEFACPAGTNCHGKFLPAEFISFITPAMLQMFTQMEEDMHPMASGNAEAERIIDASLRLLRQREQEIEELRQRASEAQQSQRLPAVTSNTLPVEAAATSTSIESDTPPEVRRAFETLELATISQCPSCRTQFDFSACICITAGESCCGRAFCALCLEVLPCSGHGNPDGIFYHPHQLEQLRRERVQRVFDEQHRQLRSPDLKRRFAECARNIVRDFRLRVR